MSHFLFLNASTREPGHIGNTETLARRAAETLPAGTQQTWCKLADLELPPFVDLRHTAGTYPMPMADAKAMLDAAPKEAMGASTKGPLFDGMAKVDNPDLGADPARAPDVQSIVKSWDAAFAKTGLRVVGGTLA